MDFENAIEDLISLCSAAGNDSLPAFSALSIFAGCIDHIRMRYKFTLPKIHHYITKNRVLDFPWVGKLLRALAKFERQGIDKIVHPYEGFSSPNTGVSVRGDRRRANPIDRQAGAAENDIRFVRLLGIRRLYIVVAQ
jgi:5'-3' exonuclease